MAEKQKQCSCTTGTGKRCKNKVIVGSKVCRVHSYGKCSMFGGGKATSTPKRTAKRARPLPPIPQKKRKTAARTPSPKKPRRALPPTPIRDPAFPGWYSFIASKALPPKTRVTLGLGVYEIDRILGEGTYGVVCKASRGGVDYAIKLSKAPADGSGQWGFTDPLGEFKMMERVAKILPASPKIFEYGLFRDAGNKAAKPERFPYGVMEMFEGNGQHLLRWIMCEAEKKTPTWGMAGFAFVVNQFCKQLLALEQNGIFFMDIKLENTVYKTEKNGEIRFSLTDFGMACDRTPAAGCLSAGTFMPPEWRGMLDWRTVDDAAELHLAQTYMVAETLNLAGEYEYCGKGLRLGSLMWKVTDPRCVDVYRDMLDVLASMTEASPKKRAVDGLEKLKNLSGQLIIAAVDVEPSAMLFLDSALRS